MSGKKVPEGLVTMTAKHVDDIDDLRPGDYSGVVWHEHKGANVEPLSRPVPGCRHLRQVVLPRGRITRRRPG